MDSITMDADQFKELKAQYDKAVKEKKHSFLFQGHKLLRSYAKYLIEFLTPKYDKN